MLSGRGGASRCSPWSAIASTRFWPFARDVLPTLAHRHGAALALVDDHELEEHQLLRAARIAMGVDGARAHVQAFARLQRDGRLPVLLPAARAFEDVEDDVRG